MRKYSILFISILCVGFLTVSCRRTHIRNKGKNAKSVTAVRSNQLVSTETSPEKVVTASDNQFLSPKPQSKEEILLCRTAYCLSYNKGTRCPNWVSWHLTAEHADGDVKRFNGYIEDEEVPEPRATNEDYRGSGWSRGHMCPAGDCKWDVKAMSESFLLTNMCPQDKSLNSGLWNRIEMDCRKWAKKYGSVYIVCGPVLYNKEHETIGENKVVVPEAFFKVVLCLQGRPKAIGFVVKNNAGTKKKDQYINTVDEVERITGYDFFPALPDDIENEVESHASIEVWR